MTDRLDVCVCGDYRHQHDERGLCRLNGVGHGGAEDCHKFVLFLTTREVLILRKPYPVSPANSRTTEKTGDGA